MEKEKSTHHAGKMAKENHIWLNAFSCINPTDEFKIGLADSILSMLEDSDRLLKQEETLSKMLYLSINKS